MGWKTKEDSKIDPSSIKQYFTEIKLHVHCCRYWKLNEWDFNNLSFPFWRLYYNSMEGGEVIYKSQSYKLDKTKIILIPPYTSFSTCLKHSKADNISGNRIESQFELDTLHELGMIDHLFIHFNLGFQFDKINPGIYEFKIDDRLKKNIDDIRFSVIDSFQTIQYQRALAIYAIIMELVSIIPQSQWISKAIDFRIMKAIEYIEIAQRVKMAPNSFLRLFKAVTSSTLQQYIQNKRIEKAILMMHNEDSTIEEIAELNGFCDRYNFSKVFKRVVKMSPAQYRKQLSLS